MTDEIKEAAGSVTEAADRAEDTAANGEEAAAGNGKKKEKVKKPLWKEILSWVECIVFALALALVIRSFIFEPVRVDGHSMDDTLADKEIMFVSKFDYASTWLSLPFTDAETQEKAARLVTGGNPNRFDVIICRYPDRGSTNFVKRVIGLPGDTVEIADGILYVNGEAYEEPYVSDEYRINGGSDGRNFGLNLVPKKGDRVEFRDGVIYLNDEIYPVGTRYFGILAQNKQILINQAGLLVVQGDDGNGVIVTENETFTVEQDNFLVMGDHRNNSNDSRAQGCISRDMIIGHVRCVLFPFSAWRDVKNGLDY